MKIIEHFRVGKEKIGNQEKLGIPDLTKRFRLSSKTTHMAESHQNRLQVWYNVVILKYGLQIMASMRSVRRVIG